MSASTTSKSRLLLALAFAAVGSMIACQSLIPTEPPTPPSRELVVPTEGHYLVYDNGLRLFVVPDHKARAVKVDVRHAVGTRDDPPEKAQLAHLAQHLLFELPTAEPGGMTLGAEALARSLHVDATTSLDETHYTHLGASRQLETYVRHTARRLAFECDAIDDATFERVRQTVQGELRRRQEDLDVRIRQRVTEVVFPEGHPYRERLAEVDAQLAALTRQDACAFIELHYVPASTTVIISGAAALGEVRALTDVQLGALPTAPRAARTPVPAVEPANQRVVIEAPVANPSAVLLFPMPRRSSADHVAAQAAREAVELVVTLVSEKQGSAIRSATPVSLGGKEAPFFGIALSSERPEELDAAIDEVLAAIYATFEGRLEPSAFDRVGQLHRLRVLEQVADVGSRSTVYADYLEQGESPGLLRTELAAIDALTSDRVHQLGYHLFAPDRTIAITLVPGPREDGRLDRVELPPAAVREPLLADAHLLAGIDSTQAHWTIAIEELEPREPRMEHIVLANGMHVVLVASSLYPIIDARLIFDAGTFQTQAQPQVAVLAHELYWSRDRKADALIGQLRLVGGQLGSQVYPQSTQFRARGLSIHLDHVIAALAESFALTTYRDGSFDAWKRRASEPREHKRLERLLGPNPAYLAALYGEGHPYASAVGDATKLRQGDVEHFHDTYYRAGKSVLVITGGFDMERVVEHVRGAFETPRELGLAVSSRWNAGAVRPPDDEVPALRTDGGRVLTQIVEGKAETRVTLGYPLAKVLGRQHASLLVLTAMLDHQLARARATMGASHGVHARLSVDRPAIEVSGELDSRRAGEALAAIFAAIAKVDDPEDFDRRFLLARRHVLHTLLEAQGDPDRFAELIATAVRHDKAVEYPRALIREVAAVTPDDVRARYEEALGGQSSVVLLEGPAAGVQSATQYNGLTYLRELPPIVRDEE